MKDEKICNSCGAIFETDKLKLTCEGFGCPHCGSISYCQVVGKTGKKWEEVNVSYEEGKGHD